MPPKQYPTNLKRPTCCACGRELVFAAIVVGGEFFSAWLCDCTDQPAGVKSDIVLAREWEEQALLYEIKKVNEDGSEPA